ncbi:MAG: hypothetical protein EBR82_11980 [Caulobacteraceae bacterium]|nr:hypothetical protein [Caulobacteraceae bacterium]
MQRLSGLSKQQQEYSGAKEEFALRQQAEKESKLAELSKTEYEKMADALRESDEYHKKLSETYFQPTQRSIQENAMLFSLIGALGFAIGAGGKGNAMQAMAAMNGMLEGSKSGDIERFKNEKSAFESNLRLLKEKHATLLETLKEKAKLASVDSTRAKHELESELSRQGADFVKQNLNRIGLDAQIKQEQARIKSLDSLIAAKQKEQKTVEHILLRDTLQQARESRKAEAEGGLTGRAGYYQKLGISAEGKELDKLDNTVSALHAVSNLQDQLKDEKVLTGLKAMGSPLATKLMSLFETKKELSPDELFSEIDKTAKKLSAPEETAIFLKNAALVAFEIEKAATGGRPAVYTIRMLGPILDPKAYTASAFNKLLEDRKNSLYAGARSLATVDQLNKAVELAGYKPVSKPAITKDEFAGYSIKSNKPQPKPEAQPQKEFPYTQ